MSMMNQRALPAVPRLGWRCHPCMQMQDC
jgi:hypothetical protein